MEKRVVFYKGKPDSAPEPPLLPDGYESLFWRPSLTAICPPGFGFYPFLVWWLLHVLHVFQNREYGVFVIRRDNKWVHRSVVTPRFYRFPFMNSRDLQVGDVWTAEHERGNSLASFALLSILRDEPIRNRTYWYLVDEDNTASIRIAERANFGTAAIGTRTAPCGVRFFGKYQIREQLHD